jgi:hypothetical protein
VELILDVAKDEIGPRGMMVILPSVGDGVPIRR